MQIETDKNGRVTGRTTGTTARGITIADPPANALDGDFVFVNGQLSESVEDFKVVRQREINDQLTDRLGRGLEWTVNGTTFTVQTRQQDKPNLLGLYLKANKLITVDGTPDATLSFRDGENVTRSLTATQMIELTEAALAFIEAQMAQAWSLKDTISDPATSTVSEVEAIVWPSAT